MDQTPTKIIHAKAGTTSADIPSGQPVMEAVFVDDRGNPTGYQKEFVLEFDNNIGVGDPTATGQGTLVTISGETVTVDNVNQVITQLNTTITNLNEVIETQKQLLANLRGAGIIDASA